MTSLRSSITAGAAPPQRKTSNPFFPFGREEWNCFCLFFAEPQEPNSSIPSIIDFIFIPLSFHEIPSIIEVLSLFDSFNYCYNTFIFILSIPQSEMKTNQIKESLLFFCWIWLNGMQWNGCAGPSFINQRLKIAGSWLQVFIPAQLQLHSNSTNSFISLINSTSLYFSSLH